MNPHSIYPTVLLVVLAILQPSFLATDVKAGKSPKRGEQSVGMIKLVGTVVANRSEKSLAVVEIDDRKQIYLREGDVVDSIQVKQIRRDRIIIDAGQGEESIRLRQSLSNITRTRTEVIQTPTLSKSFGPRPPEERNLEVVYLDRELKKLTLGNIGGLFKEVSIDPVINYGKQTGVRIFPIEPGSIFWEMGLKSSEVIREVNGKSVTVPEDAVTLLKRMKEGGEFDIKVKGRRTRQIHMIVE